MNESLASRRGGVNLNTKTL